MRTFRRDRPFLFCVVYCEYGLKVIFGISYAHQFVRNELSDDENCGISL